MKHGKEYLQFIYQTLFPIDPIWLCPVRAKYGARTEETNGKYIFLIPECEDDEMFLDLGVYGRPGGRLKDPSMHQKANKELLHKMHTIGGRQGMYNYVEFESAEAFWRDYDLTKYSKLRQKYHAEGAYPDIYTKVAHPDRKGKLKSN